MLKNLLINSLLARIVGFSCALLIPVFIGNPSITIIEILGLLLISTFSLFIGRSIARLCNLSQSVRFITSFEIVVGFSALSLIQLLFSLIFHLNAIGAFYLAGVLSSIFLIVTLRRKLDSELPIKLFSIDLFILIFISALTSLWCRDIILSVKVAQSTGILHDWPDIFIHATQVVTLKNYGSLTYHWLYLAGTQQPLYHVTSYSIPAFYSSISNDLALNITNYFWVPVGIILMGIGIYGLGCALSGRLAGLLATSAVFLLPDASMYGLKNGFFGFYWLLQTCPGSGYALAVVLIALSLFILGVRDNRPNLILISAAIGFLSAFFRVQIAAPAVFMFLMLILIFWKPEKSWHRITLLSALIITVPIMLILCESIELAPHFFSGKHSIVAFFNAVNGMATSSYGVMYIEWARHLPMLLKWMFGFIVMLVASLGLIFPLVFFWGIKKIRLQNQTQITAIPFILLIACFMVIVLIPVPIDGDLTNFGHRQFVLLYSVFLTFLMSWFAEYYFSFESKYPLIYKSGFTILPLLVTLSLFVPWIFGKNIQQPDLRPGWANNITITHIPLGLFSATEYLKKHSSVNDIVLNSNLDPFGVVVALTERQAYISRDALYKNYKGDSGKLFKSRALELKNLESIKNYSELYEFAKKNNIKWFLKGPNEMLSWPKSILNCSVFNNSDFRVYDLHSAECKS